MRIRKRKSIKVTWEGWLHLEDEQRKQRLEVYKPLSENGIKMLKRSFELNAGVLCDGDRGGCVGSPVNAYEERRWTNWSVEDMKRMLDEKGFEWEDAEDVECIDL